MYTSSSSICALHLHNSTRGIKTPFTLYRIRMKQFLNSELLNAVNNKLLSKGRIQTRKNQKIDSCIALDIVCMHGLYPNIKENSLSWNYIITIHKHYD